MKTFKRNRNLSELQRQCQARGWKFNQSRYDQGDDSVSFEFKLGRYMGIAVVNMFHGRLSGFVGKKKTHFSSENPAFGNKPWEHQLLHIVFTNEAYPEGPSKGSVLDTAKFMKTKHVQ